MMNLLKELNYYQQTFLKDICSKIIGKKYLRKKNVVIYRKENLKYYFLQTGKELNTRLEDVLEINLPKGITSLGDRVFYNCTSLVNIELPNSITSLGNSVFEYCTSLVNIKLSEGITNAKRRIRNPEDFKYSLGDRVFFNCRSLVNIELSSENSHSPVLHGHVKLPEGITSLGHSVFYHCINLKTIHMSKNINFSKYNFSSEVEIIKY